MFTIIYANRQIIIHIALQTNDLVADFVCFSSQRAVISWYQFQTINKKQKNHIANHKYLLTKAIIVNIERFHSITSDPDG